MFIIFIIYRNKRYVFIHNELVICQGNCTHLHKYTAESEAPAEI